MPAKSRAYIAGVGVTSLPSGNTSEKGIVVSLISAATKALLDAGLVYDYVDHGVGDGNRKTTSHVSKAFKAFDERGITMNQVDSGTELQSSCQLIKEKGARCVLMVAVEKSNAVSLVLVSENFIERHPYLKDESALVSESGSSRFKSGEQSNTPYSDLCRIVWQLRGWSQSKDASQQSVNGLQLSRADAKDIPKWKDIEYKQDGKHRLGYNPATKQREISLEDFEAVRGTGQRDKATGQWIQFKPKGGDRAALPKL